MLTISVKPPDKPKISLLSDHLSSDWKAPVQSNKNLRMELISLLLTPLKLPSKEVSAVKSVELFKTCTNLRESISL